MIHKTQISVVSKLEDDLGLTKSSDEHEWQEYNVVLPHVSAFKPYYNEIDAAELDKTVVYQSGGSCIIKTSYTFFCKIMDDYYTKTF